MRGDPWINVDFKKTDKSIKAINILGELPFADDSIDGVYSCHMLEHFTLEQAECFIGECKRILKAGGVLRIVVPDLENVCREYLAILEKGKHGEHVEKNINIYLLS